MKSKYPFRCILKYIPDRYGNLRDWQEANRRIVYDFKRGKVSDEHRRKILDIIKDIMQGQPEQWVVCFVPAHTQEDTEARFAPLAAFLQENLECAVCLHSVRNYKDYAPVHEKGTRETFKLHYVDKESVVGKNVVLIDDVITTGRSFREIGDKLMFMGALSIHGVCFAKTIHPNLPLKIKRKTKNQSEMDSS